jgi:hypothetical protein
LDGTNAIAGAVVDDIGANTDQGSAYRFTVANNAVTAPETGTVALALPVMVGFASVIARRRCVA